MSNISDLTLVEKVTVAAAGAICIVPLFLS